MYQVLLFVHVIAAMAWVGATIKALASMPAEARTGPAARAVLYRIESAMGTRLYAPSAGVLLISGLIMVTMSDTIGFGTPFVSLGLFTVLFGVVTGPRFGRGLDRAAKRLEAGDETGATAVVSRLRPVMLLDLALLLVTAAGMVWKWGLA